MMFRLCFVNMGESAKLGFRILLVGFCRCSLAYLPAARQNFMDLNCRYEQMERTSRSVLATRSFRHMRIH